MKKRVLSVLLALVLLAALAPAAYARMAWDPYNYDLMFNDVTYDDTFYVPVVWAVENGVTTGTSNTEFSPGWTCTRGQVVTFLWRAKVWPEPSSSYNPFRDVAAGSYYETAVLWAVEKGITNGTSDTTFSPDDTCTNAHIITFLWRANGCPTPTGAGITAGWPQSWYRDAVAWADTSGILGIDREGFDPYAYCSRGTTVTWLYNDAVRTVSTAEQFANAIAPGRIIYLEPGVYDLTEWMEVAVMEERYPVGGYVWINETADGYEFVVSGVGRLEISAAPYSGVTGKKAEIIAGPRNASVMRFENCDQIEMYDLHFGHSSGAGCRAPALEFENCASVDMMFVDMYNSFIGFNANCGILTMDSCTIHDCAEGICCVNDTFFEATGCDFSDNRRSAPYNAYGAAMISVSSSTALFRDCMFYNNTWPAGGMFLDCTDDTWTNISFYNCLFAAAAQKNIETHPLYGSRIDISSSW